MHYYVLLCIIMYYYALLCIIMYYYVLLCISYCFSRLFSVTDYLSYIKSTLETLDYTIRIGSTPTFLYFDLYLYSAYAAHYVYKQYLLHSS